MAIELSDKMLEFANKNLYGKLYSHKTDKTLFKILNFFLVLILRVRIYLINICRKILKLFSFLDKDTQSNIEIKTSLANNSNLIKKKVLEKGYCFLDNFFNNDYYLFLNENFPKKYKFNKSKNALKNYNIGFIYEKEKKNPDLELSQCLKEFYEYLQSRNFKDELNKIFGFNDFYCHNIVSSYAENYSFLIPHKDSISKTMKNLNLNFIYFIDGNETLIDNSGATCIFEDNNGEKVLLKPNTLKNSVLIYDNTKHFFHGFKIMKKNCFRKAISFQFRRGE
tara:strand:+ start:411 stop:1250 length:840 start_codon:yes stop_codon:yes gene_type:complete